MNKLTAIFILTAFSFAITSCNNNDELPSPDFPKKERKEITMSKADKRITEQNTKFAISLFNKVNEMEKEKPNWIISPFNVSAVLSLIANGADGNTLAELQNALGTKEIMMNEINSYYKRMSEELVNLDYTSGLSFSRAAFVNDTVNIYDSYADLSHKMFGTWINRIDYLNPQSLDMLNHSYNVLTNGLFPPLFDQIPEDKMAIYLNMAKFDGKWKKKFNNSETNIEDFICADGSKKQVLMMQKTEKLYYWDDETVEMAEFPYGNEAFSMSVLLPKEEALKQMSLEEIMVMMTSCIYQMEEEKREALIQTRFPRFKLKYETNWVDVLKALGITEIFDREKANLSKYAASNINISQLNQSIYVNVEENGFEEENQPTYSDMTTKEFNINRPFIFLIKEKSTGMILFMGKVTDLDWTEMDKQNSPHGKPVSE